MHSDANCDFPEPRAAYIHVPFCRHRCGYCNFTLVAGRDDLIDSYLGALEQELALLKHPRSVETLFFGGGTPSHLTPLQLRQLCGIVTAWHPLEQGGEFSVEANPDDVSQDRLEALAEAGVSRVSLGAQSFNAAKLAMLERSHSAETIDKAAERIRGHGWQLSLDLIFAAPGESLDDWRRDLERAVVLAPDHISTYGMTYEQGARYWSYKQRGRLAAVDESTECDMYESAIDELTAAGFEHYEVSNFAKPECRCRHNETYWTGGGYYAAGPGAARYVDGRRETNHRSTTTYIRRMLSGERPIESSEELPPTDRAREQFVFAMRLLEGVDVEEFERRCRFKLTELFDDFESLVDAELLVKSHGRIRLSRRGLLVSDSIWSRLLS